MKVEVFSNEFIKPSSPTPDHLRRYQFSFLDQLSPCSYNPFIYFYALNDENESNIANITLKLKKSLSQVLTLYYPLAGRFTNDNFVDCNDYGILFLEARVVKSQVSDVLSNTVPCELLNKLFPFQLDEIAELPLGVQLNIFESGGIALGVCISHRLADALSCLVFIRSWMAIARGEENGVVRPEFVSVELFPPINTGGYDPHIFMSKLSTIVTKRFVFEAPIVEALRSKYDTEARTSEENNTKRPSRVEAVSTFIWSRFMAATKLESEPEKLYTVHHAVNLRSRFDPPLPEHSFGNYYRTSTTIPSDVSNLGGLAKKMGEDVKKIDKGFVDKLRFRGDEFLASLMKGTNNGYIKGEVVPLAFTSLCRFPLYEADFGCGKPIWVGSAARCYKNLVGYMDDKTGHGIEAYICLKPEEMAKLEADTEFLALVSPTDPIIAS
ncbi:Transferase [Parasponia andersonii]|uniref:Transferase n=1 Tax=Parasponia andersonii TaxID=3476 RepID=A0A2P5CUJ5_PARAD|nr:Transferase [Parasponia andersonii]